MQTITYPAAPEILDADAQVEIQQSDACAELSSDEMNSVAGGPYVMND